MPHRHLAYRGFRCADFDPFTLHLHHAFSDFDAACAASVAKPILVGS
jgi:hypothetical protein